MIPVPRTPPTLYGPPAEHAVPAVALSHFPYPGNPHYDSRRTGQPAPRYLGPPIPNPTQPPIEFNPTQPALPVAIPVTFTPTVPAPPVPIKS